MPSSHYFLICLPIVGGVTYYYSSVFFRWPTSVTQLTLVLSLFCYAPPSSPRFSFAPQCSGSSERVPLFPSPAIRCFLPSLPVYFSLSPFLARPFLVILPLLRSSFRPFGSSPANARWAYPSTTPLLLASSSSSPATTLFSSLFSHLRRFLCLVFVHLISL